MKKSLPTLNAHPYLTWLLYIVGTVILLLLIVALVIWVLWPVRSSELQKAAMTPYSFDQAIEKVDALRSAEAKDGVKEACLSRIYHHGAPTKRSVAMIHGVSVCPQQFDSLARYFYDRGYNVYVARAPHHGHTDNLEHSKVTAKELVATANQTVDIAQAIGDDTGLIGLSGGANIATWAAGYRTEVKRLLALSPFYEPSEEQAPKWQIRPMLVLYGGRLVADSLSNPDDPQHALSYYALAQYITLFHNRAQPSVRTGLEHVALVMSDNDHEIDQHLAATTLTELAEANHTSLVYEQLPASLGVGHDIVADFNNPPVETHKDQLFAQYFRLYD